MRAVGAGAPSLDVRQCAVEPCGVGISAARGICERAIELLEAPVELHAAVDEADDADEDRLVRAHLHPRRTTTTTGHRLARRAVRRAGKACGGKRREGTQMDW